MKNNLFDSKFNLENISHALLFKSEDWKEAHNQVNLFIKKILCVSNNKRTSPCNECKACLTFDAKSNFISKSIRLRQNMIANTTLAGFMAGIAKIASLLILDTLYSLLSISK